MNCTFCSLSCCCCHIEQKHEEREAESNFKTKFQTIGNFRDYYNPNLNFCPKVHKSEECSSEQSSSLTTFSFHRQLRVIHHNEPLNPSPLPSPNPHNPLPHCTSPCPCPSLPPNPKLTSVCLASLPINPPLRNHLSKRCKTPHHNPHPRRNLRLGSLLLHRLLQHPPQRNREIPLKYS